MQRERIATKVEMADKKRVVTYKEYNCVRSVLAAVAKLPEVADTDDLITLSAANLQVYVEVRTCKKPAAGKLKTVYIDQVVAVVGNDIRLAPGSVPDGYGAWLATQPPSPRTE